jgi:hypothetical protein
MKEPKRFWDDNYGLVRRGVRRNPSLTEYLGEVILDPRSPDLTDRTPPPMLGPITNPGDLAAIFQQPELTDPSTMPGSEVTTPARALRTVTDAGIPNEPAPPETLPAFPWGLDTRRGAMDRGDAHEPRPLDDVRRGLEPPTAPPQIGGYHQATNETEWDASVIRAQRAIAAERQRQRMEAAMRENETRRQHQQTFGVLAPFLPTGQELPNHINGAWQNFQGWARDAAHTEVARRRAARNRQSAR